MSAESGKPTIMAVFERTLHAESKATAAHQRMDRFESSVKDDLGEIKGLLQKNAEEMKIVVAWMNRSKGWAAAGVLAAGLVGGILSRVLMKVL